MGIHAGKMFWFAGTTAPAGALECNGQAVSRTTYADLFAAIGTTWDNFNGAASPAGTDFRVPNQADSGNALAFCGHESGTDNVGDYHASTNESHTHTGSTDDPGNHTHLCSVWSQWTNLASGGGTYMRSGSGGGISLLSNGSHTHTVTPANDGGSIGQPDSVEMMLCIWY